MDWWIRDLIIYVVALIALTLTGLPIVFALGLAAVGGIYFAFGPSMFPAMGYVGWNALTSFIIGAIPLFVLMGFLLFETGLSKVIYAGISPSLDRFLPGGLLHSNIVVGAVFAASSGSSVASCATIGEVALPEMESRGYPRGLAAGSVAAGSTLGMIIPPSISLIIYGFMAGYSVGKLFIGGIIPGVILAVTYMVYIALRLKLQPSLRGVTPPKKSWGLCLRELVKVVPVILLVIAVMGSIYAGIATPTEAAAIGCTVVLVMATGYRLLSLDALKRATEKTIVTSSMILMIYLSGKFVGIYLVNTGITTGLAAYVSALEVHPLLIFTGIIIMYLFLGCIMDGITMMVVTIPIVVPTIIVLGFDPIWFGVVLTMLVECGLLTPPVGVNLFILQGLRPDYPFMGIVKGCFPFFLVLTANIFLMLAFPQLITFLPKTMMG